MRFTKFQFDGSLEFEISRLTIEPITTGCFFIGTETCEAKELRNCKTFTPLRESENVEVREFVAKNQKIVPEELVSSFSAGFN